MLPVRWAARNRRAAKPDAVYGTVMRTAGLGWVRSTIAAVAAVLALAAGACQLQGKCEYITDPGLVDAGRGSLQTYCCGHLLDPYTWESTPITQGLPYGAQHEWELHARGLSGRIYEVVPYIAAALPPDPTKEAVQWVVAPGNLAEIKIINGAEPIILVHNDTCAEYYLRVVVRAAPDAGP